MRHAPLLALIALVASGCSTSKTPDLGRLYNAPAMGIGSDRNPVVVIPGILGTKLIDNDTNTQVWGAFVYGAADADTPEGARLVALPMGPQPLHLLTDNVQPTEALDTLELDLGFLRGLKIGAYVDILKLLAVGQYRDETLGEAGAIDYGGLHYTCFQYGYDWRRDVSEQSVGLHELIMAALDTANDALGDSSPRKVDVVAHSMGGLVLRYYLRYGPNPIGPNGELPELTWEGARYVENAILVGTPNAGSVLSLVQLVDGVKFAPFTPTFRPALLGTMPAIFELLPRTRHARVVDVNDNPVDLFDLQTWIDYEWGLADPDQDRVLKQLLPGIDSKAERRKIAIDHLEKVLRQTAAFHEAIDRPAQPPQSLHLHLIAGDAEETPGVIRVSESGRLRITSDLPGDGTVTRESALMDERVGSGYVPRLRSPIRWSNVLFLSTDHLGLTRDPAFVDNVLYLLLEAPRTN